MSRSLKWLLASLFFVLLVATPILGHEADDEDDEDEAPAVEDDEKDVVVLTTKNFEKYVKGHKFALVEFYAPWCGHCKTLRPHYAKAATAVKAFDPEIVIAKVDATVEGELAQKFGVQGYPTLKWFVDGEPTEYNGPREAEGITKWVIKKAGPPAVTVETAEKLKELEAESQVVIVGYFASFEGAEYEAFKSVAQKIEDVVFVETTVAAVAEAAGLSAAPGLVAVKNFKGEERAVVPLTGELTADEIKAFVVAEKMPLTIEFNQDNSDKIFNSGIPVQVILWAGAAEFEASSPVLAAFNAVAKQFKGKLVFVTVNNEGASHEPVTNYFGLKGASAPVVMGFWMEKNRKYRMDLSAGVTEEALSAFAASVLDGTAVPDFKSAPIPENNKEGDVTVVVGKTVESIVLDPTKDVLLEVYAPWCGHCKQLEPTYKKLAKRFRAAADLVTIAKMDGTENEHPTIEVKGFPTILFYPAGENKQPIPFDGGDRSLKAMTAFIKKHAKNTLPELKSKKEKKEEKDEL